MTITEADILARNEVTPRERVVVNVAVAWTLRAQKAVARCSSKIGKGKRYEGPIAGDALDRFAADEARWLAMSRCVRDIVRLRRGLPLQRVTLVGWRSNTRMHDRHDVAKLAEKVGVAEAAKRTGLQPNSVHTHIRRVKAA